MISMAQYREQVEKYDLLYDDWSAEEAEQAERDRVGQ